MMNLGRFVEKNPDADVLREMIAFRRAADGGRGRRPDGLLKARLGLLAEIVARYGQSIADRTSAPCGRRLRRTV